MVWYTAPKVVITREFMSIKERVRSHPLYKPVQRWKAHVTRFTRPDGHPLYKLATIKKYARDFKLDTFVETGTNLGYTLEHARKYFKHLYSVELDAGLYEKAVRRFSDPDIHLFQGDSVSFLNKLSLDAPVLYWLDAHYCEMATGEQTAGTLADIPVIGELAACFKHWKPNTVILIDDAFLFAADGPYPIIEEIRAMASQRKLRVVVEHEIIRITA